MIEIIYSTPALKKGPATVSFDTVKEAFKFIIFNSPMRVEAIRVSGDAVKEFN